MKQAIQRYSTKRGQSGIHAGNLQFYHDIHPDLDMDFFLTCTCPVELVKCRNMYMRLRHGAPLGIHMYNTLGGKHQHSCPCCQSPKETTRHAVVDCPAYQGPRERFLDATRLSAPELRSDFDDIFDWPNTPGTTTGRICALYNFLRDMAVIRQEAAMARLPAFSKSPSKRRSPRKGSARPPPQGTSGAPNAARTLF